MKNIENEFILELTDYHFFSLPLINELGCLNSYIKLMCNKNFPQCEPTKDITKPPCKKVCLNFLNNCGTWKYLCDDYKDEYCSN